MTTFLWKGKDGNLYSYNDTADEGSFERKAKPTDAPGKVVSVSGMKIMIDERFDVPSEYIKATEGRGQRQENIMVKRRRGNGTVRKHRRKKKKGGTTIVKRHKRRPRR